MILLARIWSGWIIVAGVGAAVVAVPVSWVVAVCANAAGPPMASATATAAAVLSLRIASTSSPDWDAQQTGPFGDPFPMDWMILILILEPNIASRRFLESLSAEGIVHGYAPVEGAERDRRAGDARIQAWRVEDEPRTQGEEPEAGDRDRLARGRRVQIREQRKKPREPQAN